MHTAADDAPPAAPPAAEPAQEPAAEPEAATEPAADAKPAAKPAKKPKASAAPPPPLADASSEDDDYAGEEEGADDDDDDDSEADDGAGSPEDEDVSESIEETEDEDGDEPADADDEEEGATSASEEDAAPPRAHSVHVAPPKAAKASAAAPPKAKAPAAPAPKPAARPAAKPAAAPKGVRAPPRPPHTLRAALDPSNYDAAYTKPDLGLLARLPSSAERLRAAAAKGEQPNEADRDDVSTFLTSAELFLWEEHRKHKALRLFLALLVAGKLDVDRTPREAGSVDGALPLGGGPAVTKARQRGGGPAHYLVTVTVNPVKLWLRVRKQLANPAVPDLDVFRAAFEKDNGLDVSFLVPWPAARDDFEDGVALLAEPMKFLVPHALLAPAGAFFKAAAAFNAIGNLAGDAYGAMGVDAAFKLARELVINFSNKTYRR